MGWEWKLSDGNGRHGTIGRGRSGYLELGRALDDFDVVYAFPWMGEEPMMLDLMRCHGRQDVLFVLHTTQNGTRIYQGGPNRVASFRSPRYSHRSQFRTSRDAAAHPQP